MLTAEMAAAEVKKKAAEEALQLQEEIAQKVDEIKNFDEKSADLESAKKKEAEFSKMADEAIALMQQQVAKETNPETKKILDAQLDETMTLLGKRIKDIIDVRKNFEMADSLNKQSQEVEKAKADREAQAKAADTDAKALDQKTKDLTELQEKKYTELATIIKSFGDAYFDSGKLGATMKFFKKKGKVTGAEDLGLYEYDGPLRVNPFGGGVANGVIIDFEKAINNINKDLVAALDKAKTPEERSAAYVESFKKMGAIVKFIESIDWNITSKSLKFLEKMENDKGKLTTSKDKPAVGEDKRVTIEETIMALFASYEATEAARRKKAESEAELARIAGTETDAQAALEKLKAQLGDKLDIETKTRQELIDRFDKLTTVIQKYLDSLPKAPEGKASGGWISGGVSGKDSVPIMGMPNEFIVKASQARKHGKLLTAINNGNFNGLAFSARSLTGAGGANTTSTISVGDINVAITSNDNTKITPQIVTEMGRALKREIMRGNVPALT
jgi:hypothetical protein